MRKPQQRPRQPKKREMLVIHNANQHEFVPRLIAAAQVAEYIGSPYHRMAGSPMGLRSERRWPLASKCPAFWDRAAATRALREGLRAGRVSAQWEGNFPRFIWHLQEETLYEARLSNKELGGYHGYPLEDRREWPANI
jgi:hypothetical protein